MVLEHFNIFNIENKPWKMFFWGFLYSIIALGLSYWVFKSHAGLVMVFLVVVASLPLIYKAIKKEEYADISLGTEKEMLKEHTKVVYLFIFLFLGMVCGFTSIYLLVPNSVSSQIFGVQLNTISTLKIQGAFSNKPNAFSIIFFNNVRVLVLAMLFSFFYGSGALFILTWNASVISAAIGNFIRTNASFYANTIGLARIAGYLKVSSLGLLRYMTHGIFEITAYFIAAIAGGIISFAIIKHDFMTKKFENVVVDSADLILISVAILFIAALIEVYVTPLMF